MTLKELKATVQQLVGRANTKEAIDIIITWAQENDRKQLKTDAALLKANFTQHNRDKRLGLLSFAEANVQQSKITYGVLNLLDNEDVPIRDNNEDTSIKNKPHAPPSNEPTKILMLTSNPANSVKLDLGKEHSIIVQKIQQKQGDFYFKLNKAVSGTEFKEITQIEEPDILHFSGHGTKGKYAGIVVQNDEKNEEDYIPIKGLKALFKFFKNRFNLKVVLLNACHTQEQAAVISEFVDFVIGTNVAIGDTAASAFSSGFYFQIAQDEKMNIEAAFESGRTEAVMKGADEENFVIYRHGKLIEV